MAEDERKRALNPCVVPRPGDKWAFIRTMADTLLLPCETLAISFLYVNRFMKFCRSTEVTSPLDDFTLALASLYLATKTTEAPRRLRDLLTPAWRLLQSNKDGAMPLTIPSTTYDLLRSTVVQAELMLLRVLEFKLRILSPLEFLPRYLNRTIGENNATSCGWGGTEDYNGSTSEHKDEYQIVSLMETGVGKAAQLGAVEACKDYQLANHFPARTVAAACLYSTLKTRGLILTEDIESWLSNITSCRVSAEDFKEAVTIIESS